MICLIGHVRRDAFLEALDGQALRVRILEKKPKNVDDALNMASHLEVFDIMGSTGQEAEKSKSRFPRSAAGGKESTGSEEKKMSEEILRQLAHLTVLMSSFRRDLDRQQQEITTLKEIRKPPYSGKCNLSPVPHPAGSPWPGASSSFPESAQVQLESAGLGRGPVQNGGGGHRSRTGDTCRNCLERGYWAREYRAAEEHGNTPEAPRAMRGSVSIVTDGRNGVDVYLALRLNGKVVYGLLDTGYDTSVVSPRVIPDLQLKQTTQKLYSANGTEIALLGEVELTLSMSGQEVTAAVVVSEEVDDLILGIDWLGRHRCRWSFAQNTIEIDGKVVRLISRPRQNMLRRIYAV